MKFLLKFVTRLFRRQNPRVFRGEAGLNAHNSVSQVDVNVRNASEENSSTYRGDEIVRHSEFDHFANSKDRYKNEALDALLQKLLNTTREWSIQYGYDSVPPGVLLQQACAMIDAAEIMFRED